MNENRTLIKKDIVDELGNKGFELIHDDFRMRHFPIDVGFRISFYDSNISEWSKEVIALKPSQ